MRCSCDDTDDEIDNNDSNFENMLYSLSLSISLLIIMITVIILILMTTTSLLFFSDKITSESPTYVRAQMIKVRTKSQTIFFY